jgi:hypothetical protein
MKDRETSARISIGGQTYQIGLMDPRKACWLFGFISSKAPAQGKWGEVLRVALGRCTQEEFAEVQEAVLKCVTRIDPPTENNSVEMPTVVILNGSIVDDVLKSSNYLYEATIAAISTNLSPFLAVDGSKEAPAAA